VRLVCGTIDAGCGSFPALELGGGFGGGIVERYTLRGLSDEVRGRGDRPASR
jgi:hypothetical protein